MVRNGIEAGAFVFGSGKRALAAFQGRRVVAIRSGDLTRTHRKRLVRGGFLHRVMKGWYIPVRHDQTAGEGTAWYTSFRDFAPPTSPAASVRAGAFLPNNRHRFTPVTGHGAATASRVHAQGRQQTHGITVQDVAVRRQVYPAGGA